MSRAQETNGQLYNEPMSYGSSDQQPLHSAESEPTAIQTRTPTHASTRSILPGLCRRNTNRRDGGRKASLMSQLSEHFVPAKPVGDAPGFWQGLRAIIFASWLNILLFCIPISWAFHWAMPDSPVLIFVFSFLAIIPLAKLLALATDELSMRVGQTLAGLLNATLGNVVELIVAVIAIVKCELQVVQSSLVGSILSNLLLVLGMCFFAGGTRFQEQGFGSSASQINSSLLTLSVIAVLLPGAFHLAVQPDASDPTHDPLTDGQEGADIKKLSHGVAIILLFIYGSYLVFQLWSHASLYDDNHKDNFKSTRYDESVTNGNATAVFDKFTGKVAKRLHIRQKGGEKSSELAESSNGHANGYANGSRQAENGEENDETHDGTDVEAHAGKEPEEEVETPSMSLIMCIVMLIVVTVLVAVTAEFLVSSIDGVTSGSSGLSKEWVGLILLPIVGNAAEHVTAVTVSVKDKLTLSIGVAVGSSIQIALFVIPLMVVIAWCLGKPLLLLFDPFESVTLFLAVLTVNYCVADGKSNWLEGMILMCLYVIIAVMFWFYPGSDIANVLAECT